MWLWILPPRSTALAGNDPRLRTLPPPVDSAETIFSRQLERYPPHPARPRLVPLSPSSGRWLKIRFYGPTPGAWLTALENSSPSGVGGRGARSPEVRWEMETGAPESKDFPRWPFTKPSEEQGSGKVRLFSIRCLTTCVSGGDLRKKQHVLLWFPCCVWYRCKGPGANCRAVS